MSFTKQFSDIQVIVYSPLKYFFFFFLEKKQCNPSLPCHFLIPPFLPWCVNTGDVWTDPQRPGASVCQEREKGPAPPGPGQAEEMIDRHMARVGWSLGLSSPDTLDTCLHLKRIREVSAIRPKLHQGGALTALLIPIQSFQIYTAV